MFIMLYLSEVLFSVPWVGYRELIEWQVAVALPRKEGVQIPTHTFWKVKRMFSWKIFAPSKADNLQANKKMKLLTCSSLMMQRHKYSISLLIADYFYFCPFQAQLLQ